MDTEAIVAIAVVVLIFAIVPVYYMRAQKAAKIRKNTTREQLD